MITERKIRSAYGLARRSWLDKLKGQTVCRVLGHVWFGANDDPTQPADPFCGSCLKILRVSP